MEKNLEDLEDRFTAFEFTALLSGEYDEYNAILALHAGAGGVDAQDWTEMLLRMFLRFAEKQGWTAAIVDESRGDEAGVKSATVHVSGRYAYGNLKTEAGVHRLVRISPFDAEKMRHTSFALAEVLPEFAELEEMPLDEKDLRIDTFLSSGHGGQSVQTTYSAVRIVHAPTGITVTCQNERSQKQNKETALKILRAKLLQLELEKQQKEKQQIRGEYHEAAWGNQIRSYVLHPYKLVKDHRTKFESKDPDAVLGGDLKPFIEAELKREAAEREKDALTEGGKSA
jgi:peptide chain release factor 2